MTKQQKLKTTKLIVLFCFLRTWWSVRPGWVLPLPKFTVLLSLCLPFTNSSTIFCLPLFFFSLSISSLCLYALLVSISFLLCVVSSLSPSYSRSWQLSAHCMSWDKESLCTHYKSSTCTVCLTIGQKCHSVVFRPQGYFRLLPVFP